MIMNPDIIDNMEAMLEARKLREAAAKLYSSVQPQDCIECGHQISSRRQHTHKGTDVCELCAGKE